jgi:hypothetical protein
MAFLRSGAGFVAGFALAAAIAFVVFGAGRRGASAPDEDVAENLATAAYLLLVTSLPAAAGFAAVACASRAWRELRPSTAMWIGLACGFLGYAAVLTGLGGLTGRVLPFPLGALGAALRLVVPGALLGLLALGAARALGVRRVGHG